MIYGDVFVNMKGLVILNTSGITADFGKDMTVQVGSCSVIPELLRSHANEITFIQCLHDF